MIDFLFYLAGKETEPSVIIEKFHIYKAQLQEAMDYKDYLALDVKIKKAEEMYNLKGASDSEQDALDKLKMDKMAAKIWWGKLNEHVIKSLQKINDRNAKTVEAVKQPGIFNAKTINFIQGDKNDKVA
jgi:hypothetical protein